MFNRLSPWIITSISLNYNKELWEVIAWEKLWEGNSVIQYGATIEEALEAAGKAIADGNYWKPNRQREALASAASDLLSVIGLRPKTQPEAKRRKA